MTITAVRKYGIPGSAVEYRPDPGLPVDRWMQCTDSGNAETTRKIISDLFGGRPSCVIDPFCGAGSSAVAARMLRVPFLGMDLDPARACVASAKAAARLGDGPADTFVAGCLRLTHALSPHRRPVFHEMVRADLLAMPDPVPDTEVWCGDALTPAGWDPVPRGIEDWVVYASPPFAAASPPKASGLRRWATDLLKPVDRDHRPAGRLHEPRTYLDTVTTLMRRLTRLGQGLVILEHEPAGPGEHDVGKVAAAIDRVAGVSRVEPLTVGTFAAGRPFSLIVCEMS